MLTKEDVCMYSECLGILKTLKMRGHDCKISMDNRFYVTSGNETQKYSICVFGHADYGLNDKMVIHKHDITIQDALKTLTEFSEKDNKKMLTNNDNTLAECLHLLKKIRQSGKICCIDTVYWYHTDSVEIRYTTSIKVDEKFVIELFDNLEKTKAYLLDFEPEYKIERTAELSIIAANRKYASTMFQRGTSGLII